MQLSITPYTHRIDQLIIVSFIFQQLLLGFSIRRSKITPAQCLAIEIDFEQINILFSDKSKKREK